MTLETAIYRLVVALLCGALIGLERQWRQKMAGLRTNVLVATGSASFALFGAYMPNPDNLHMAGQIVTGIGFLGAGVIMHEGTSVHGLNTAATLWCSAAVGVFAGIGLSAEAAAVAAVITFINMSMWRIGVLLNRYTPSPAELPVRYAIRVVVAKSREADLRKALLDTFAAKDLGLVALKSVPIAGVAPDEAVALEAAAIASRRDDAGIEALVIRFAADPAVSDVEWHIPPEAHPPASS